MRYIGALALMALVGCAADPLEPATTQSNGVVIALVARVEGCRVYRIEGAGSGVYTTICGPETITTTTIRTAYCGRGCVRHIPMMDITRRVLP